mgnify:CR=1 FL=1
MCTSLDKGTQLQVKYDNKVKGVLDFIHEGVKAGENVIIHCRLGTNRSVMVALAYLMIFHRMRAQDAIDLINHNPDSRRILVNAWNAAEVSSDDVALPPCHTFFQFYVAKDRLSLQMYQRSCDMFLGVPLNIASYSILLCMGARITNLIPHEFIHTLGDAHIYLNHIDAVKAQLGRPPLPLPKLSIADRGQETIDDFVYDDFELINYQSHDAIKADMAV